MRSRSRDNGEPSPRTSVVGRLRTERVAQSRNGRSLGAVEGLPGNLRASALRRRIITAVRDALLTHQPLKVAGASVVRARQRNSRICRPAGAASTWRGSALRLVVRTESPYAAGTAGRPVVTRGKGADPLGGYTRRSHILVIALTSALVVPYCAPAGGALPTTAIRPSAAIATSSPDPIAATASGATTIANQRP